MDKEDSGSPDQVDQQLGSPVQVNPQTLQLKDQPTGLIKNKSSEEEVVAVSKTPQVVQRPVIKSFDNGEEQLPLPDSKKLLPQASTTYDKQTQGAINIVNIKDQLKQQQHQQVAHLNSEPIKVKLVKSGEEEKKTDKLDLTKPEQPKLEKALTMKAKECLLQPIKKVSDLETMPEDPLGVLEQELKLMDARNEKRIPQKEIESKQNMKQREEIKSVEHIGNKNKKNSSKKLDKNSLSYKSGLMFQNGKHGQPQTSAGERQRSHFAGSLNPHKDLLVARMLGTVRRTKKGSKQ